MNNIFDINKETKLYKVIENDNGDLVYCDKDSNAIDTSVDGWQNKLVEICNVGDLQWEEVFPLLEKNKNKDTKIYYKSSGIIKFDGEKEYYSTENLKETYLKEPEEIVTYENRPSRANMQPEENIVMFAKMKDTNKYLYFTNKINSNLINKAIFSTGFSMFKCLNDIYTKYIYYYIQTNEWIEYKNNNSTGTTQKGIGEEIINKSIKLPQPYKEFSSLEIQKSLSFLIEQSFQGIEDKIDKLNTLEVILDKNKESFLDEVFMDDTIETKNENGEKVLEKTSQLKYDTLFKVMENDIGDLVYDLDKNGDKVELCLLSEIEFEEKFIYTSKDWKKDFNRFLKEKKKITNSKDLINLLNIDKKYCCIQRMGETPSNEDDKLIGVNDNQIAWFNIASLQLFKNNVIKDTKIIEDSILKTKIENITSIKNIPITKNDIMVSFKLTVGVSKLYLSNDYSVCNEAIDVLTPCNNTYSYYLNYIIGDLYLKNVGNNSLQGGTLNDDIKKIISIKFPKQTINKETKELITSLDIQKSLSKYIEETLTEIERKKDNIEKMIMILNKQKDNILNTIFSF